MLSRTTRIILGCIATLLFATFIFGLAHSISVGFAGFMGGLPFVIIALVVFSMALYDLWNETIKQD